MGSKQLTEAKTLKEYDVQKDSTLRLYLQWNTTTSNPSRTSSCHHHHRNRLKRSESFIGSAVYESPDTEEINEENLVYTSTRKRKIETVEVYPCNFAPTIEAYLQWLKEERSEHKRKGHITTEGGTSCTQTARGWTQGFEEGVPAKKGRYGEKYPQENCSRRTGLDLPIDYPWWMTLFSTKMKRKRVLIGEVPSDTNRMHL